MNQGSVLAQIQIWNMNQLSIEEIAYSKCNCIVHQKTINSYIWITNSDMWCHSISHPQVNSLGENW